MKRYIRIVLCMILALTLFTGCGGSNVQSKKLYNEGTYTATVSAMQGPLTVEVIVSKDAIIEVRVTEHMETPGVGDIPVNIIPEQIVENQTLSVDTISGATMTRGAILLAVEECLKQAGADISALKVPVERESTTDLEKTADVIIVGGGGAGLSAAVSAVNDGASVILIEKTGFLGGNSIVAGGIYNAPNPTLQDYSLEKRSESLESLITDAISETPVNAEHKALIEAVKREYEEYLKTDKTLFDSPNWFALQTWNGGDKVGDLNMVKLLTYNALDGLKWMESLGMEFEHQVSHGGGALYPRTHWAVLPNGTGYIKALANVLQSNPNYELMLETTGVNLITEGNKVIGVLAQNKDGKQITLSANKGVILTTGGFAGNVKLRQEYAEGEKWPNLGPNVATSNMPGVTGDGLFMARDAGADLINMDQIQLLPYCNPHNGATYDIVSGSGAMVFINKEGERFVREDGRRDEMSKAIIAQTDGMMYMLQSADGIPDPNSARALGGQLLSYYLETNHAGYVSADTLEELADKIGVPADGLKQTVKDYNKYVESGNADPFGVVSYRGKLENGPWYAYPRKPAVHHTMGGIKVDEQTRVLRPDGSVIEGLYAAGEITGNLHGANRLGGNAIVDFIVFGRIAGTNAAK